MLQVVLDRPGRFLRQDVPEPSCPDGQALVRVRRVGVCGTDLHAFTGRQPFFQYPRVLGHELGVEIVRVGATAPIPIWRARTGNQPAHDHRIPQRLG